MSGAKFPFWRVVPAERPGTYTLPVLRPATVGPEGAPHVMGGVALGAALDALSLESQLPPLWANIQFLSPTQHAEQLDIRCEQCGGGQSVGQWLAEMSVNGRPTHRVSAALGAREPSEQRIFAQMPDVPPPAQCEEFFNDRIGDPGSLQDQIEWRLAEQDVDKGTLAMWTRNTAGMPVDNGWLAIVSDFFLGAHPASHGGSSLDATFRFVQSADPGWVLSITEMAAFDRGVAHGHARHFDEQGRLLAISSQTGVLPRIPISEAMT